MIEHTVFVPSGASRRETAILLTGTAEEYGIDQHSIKATGAGFFITDELADVIFEDQPEEVEPDPEPEPEPEPEPDPTTTKTSGNRAAKKNNTKKE